MVGAEEYGGDAMAVLTAVAALRRRNTESTVTYIDKERRSAWPLLEVAEEAAAAAIVAARAPERARLG